MMTPYFIDYETNGLNFWEEGYFIECIGLSWFNAGSDELQQYFARGPANVEAVLKRLSTKQIPLAAYNIGFEMGVSQCVFPQYPLNWQVDVMRLRQLYGRGQGGMKMKEGKMRFDYQYMEPFGFGLKDAVRMFLPEFKDYEKDLHAWMKTAGYSWDKVDLFPEDLLKPYNLMDTVATAQLYKKFTEFFAETGYDWLPDHADYMFMVKQIGEAKIRGVQVDMPALAENIATLETDLHSIDSKIKATFADEMHAVKQARFDAYKELTPRGRKTIDDMDDFNINSKKQLGELAVDQLEIQAKLFTEKGSPSFKKAHLGQWAALGEMLAGRGGKTIALQQCKALAELAEGDSKWHLGLKACGTTTGRFSGGN